MVGAGGLKHIIITGLLINLPALFIILFAICVHKFINT